MANLAVYTGIVLIIILERLKYKLISSQNSFLVFLMGFLTTLPHEFSHYLIALILGGRPEGIYLIPRKVKAGEYIHWTFGSVNARINSFTGFFIGIAPVIYLVASYFLAKYYFLYFDWDFRNILIFFFIEWVLIENGIPSFDDLKIALSSYKGLFVFLVFISVSLVISL